MSPSAVQKMATLEWGVASQPIASEAVSGDQHIVKPFDGGVLLAVVDGVGHGNEATAAARVALNIMEEYAHESVISIVRRCHEALAKTRGVVLAVASLNPMENTITWLGVGNVEALLLRSHSGKAYERVLQRSGIVGYQLPALHTSVTPVTPGDLLIFASDGVRTNFAEAIALNEAPQRLASRILERHFKGNDDALVLVARYLGQPHE